jgi:hypothetical protein
VKAICLLGTQVSVREEGEEKKTNKYIHYQCLPIFTQRWESEESERERKREGGEGG